MRTLNRPELHICDRDTTPDKDPKYLAHVNAVNARDAGTAFSTSKREMENYLHPAAIVEAYAENGHEIALPEFFDESDDVPTLVAQALHQANSETPWEDLPEVKQKKKCSRTKRVLNGEAARRMNVERLRAIDGYDEIRSWLETLQKMIEQ